MADHLVKISVSGLRSLARVSVPTKGLTVLIGENGAGKSALVEAFELLRKAAAPTFLPELNRVHGGLSALLRDGASSLGLAISIEGDEGPIAYSFSLAEEGQLVVFQHEVLVGPIAGQEGPQRIIDRDRSKALVYNEKDGKLISVALPKGLSLISAFGSLPPQRAIERVVAVLNSIEVHVPFDARAAWVNRERGWTSPLRDPALIEPVASLGRLGTNLVNCFHALRNNFGEGHWQETLEFVRMGLGPDVKSVNTRAGAGGGVIALSLDVEGLASQVPAVSLADGTLAYLAFVALVRLPSQRSVLVFDEPDLYLHPSLAVRILGFLEDLAETTPVIVTTHSDRLLDAVTNPGEAVRLCRLRREPGTASATSRFTEIVRPNAESLERWLKRYRGIGDLRAEGMEDVVMTDADASGDPT